MTVSCCCLTYGRNALLAEAVESFIRQDYPHRELVVFNTLASQQITISHPLVRVINHTPRPASLGETRNLAIEQCRGDYILTWDDDDIYLPHYVSWLVAHLAGGEWVRQAGRFNLDRWVVTGTSEQAMNQFLFSKGAWRRAGGYPVGVDSGEDAQFFARLAACAKGRKVECPAAEYGFLYGWDNGAYHVSGGGVNRAGKATALQRAQRQVSATSQPRGRVQITPRWRKDYTAEASAFPRRAKTGK